MNSKYIYIYAKYEKEQYIFIVYLLFIYSILTVYLQLVYQKRPYFFISKKVIKNQFFITLLISHNIDKNLQSNNISFSSFIYK